ncbi:hypothetical protein ANO11243_080150 [Dothideomycetidae sp. 11243]|nr:hypothetical protein ANO11243_080150 [fungal sp. No.11243]
MPLILPLLLFISLASGIPSSATNTTATPTYCGTTWVSVYSPTYTIDFDIPSITPPLPCPGAYSTQDGACCSGSCISCPNFAFCGPSAGNISARSIEDGGDRCTCSDGELLYSMPLDPCVKENPFYSGCPGNMAEGVCCSGPGLFFSSNYSSSTTASLVATSADLDGFGGETEATTTYTPVCSSGTALFSLVTEAGATSTSTYPPGVGYSNTLCYTCPLYTRTSTSRSRGGVAARTAPAGPAAAMVTVVAGAVAAWGVM